MEPLSGCVSSYLQVHIIYITVFDKSAVMSLRINDTGFTETWCLSTRYHGVILKKTSILTITTLRTSNFAQHAAECFLQREGYVSHRKSNKMQQCIKILISYLYEAQHVSGDTLPIIRSLKLHQQPLVLHTWRVVGRVVAGRCQVECTLPVSVQQLHVQQPSTYTKPEATSAVLGS